MLTASENIPTTIDELLPPDLAAAIDRLDVLSRKLLQGKLPGERRSKRRGRSVEFDDFRPYVPGDDLRHVDWNILGRLDKLYVKLFRDEEDLALDIALDVSASMRVGAAGEEPGKIAFAARLAMCLAYIGLANQNRVSLALVGGRFGEHTDGPMILRPARGRRHVRLFADALLGALSHARSRGTQGDDTPLMGAADALFMEDMRVFSRARAGRGVGVVISDFLMPAACVRGVALLAGASGSHDTFAFQVLTPGERDPALLRERGLLGDVRLIDVESGTGLDVTVTPQTLRARNHALAAHERALREACAMQGVAFVPLSTTSSVSDLLRTTLRSRGIVG